MIHFAGAVLCAVLAVVSPEQPETRDERVLAYVSDITVNPDSSLLVRETITVRALNDQIRHGIYRDFPTSYVANFLSRVTTTFEVQEVLRDGQPEPNHTESRTNGLRLYIGDANTFVAPGEHTYTLTYRTEGQMGFRKGGDELYWNVTGSGWVFPIDRVKATVHLPRAVDGQQLRLNGFTGAQGATEQKYTASIEPSGAITFLATRPLGSYEGLTISVIFPKGLVEQPSFGSALRKWALDNQALRLALFGTLLTFSYFVFAWFLVGRDPAPGQFRARSEPPKDISPAAARFLTRMGYDNYVFATALVSLAVKKVIRIKETDQYYHVESLGESDGSCSPEERALLSKLLPSGGSIAFKQVNHRRISAAIQACQTSLRNQYEKRYFVTNYGYFLPGVALALGTIGISLYMAPHSPDVPVLFLCLWLSIWSIGCLVLGMMVVMSWGQAFRGVTQFFSALFYTAFATPFFAAEVFVLVKIFGSSAAWSLPLIVLLAVMNHAFYQWMKAPTKFGRKALDEIDGFKAYLQGGKGQMQNLQMTAPEPEQFNSYLPYAMALGIDEDWADRFTATLGDAQRDDSHFRSYRPYWYDGDLWDRRGMHGFSDSLSTSMTSVIASSATAPGSSSGSSSSGGGSSGGGGGGGGGGGW